jgi:hypothetical protein
MRQLIVSSPERLNVAESPADGSKKTSVILSLLKDPAQKWKSLTDHDGFTVSRHAGLSNRVGPSTGSG